MSRRVCSTAGCPTLVPAGARGGRCTSCQRSSDKARGTREERGYGAEHQAASREWQRKVDAGELVICWRCREPITRVVHLGHGDADRTITRGPEHPFCNLSAAGRHR